MDVRIDAAGGDDLALARDRLPSRSDDDGDIRLTSGLPALPMAAMSPSLIADVGLDDSPVIEDQRVGDDRIDRALARVRCDCPMPSRMTLPPPNLTSSP